MKTFKKVVMAGYTQETLGENEWKRLEGLSDERVLLPKDSPDILKHLADAECLLVRLGATVDKKMIDAAPNLKYIGMLGTGYGRIDTAYATQKGIAVCNIAGYSTSGVAELAFGLIIEHIRDLERAKVQARNGDYSEATFKGYEIKGKNFGVIGLGRIGRRVAEIARNGFESEVAYWSRNRKLDAESAGIYFKELEPLLKDSDFISLNLSYSPETNGFLNKERIGMLKPGAVVVNLAPMELVDIDALEQRLKRANITFILDHSDELSPEQAKQLAGYENCIMYPPIGYITKEATAAKLSMFVDNIERFLAGSPVNKVN